MTEQKHASFEHWCIQYRGEGPIILRSTWTAHWRELQPDHPQYELAKMEWKRRAEERPVWKKWEDTEYVRVPAESDARVREQVMAQYG